MEKVMYNINTIRTEFLSIAGWRQNEDPSGVQLTDMLTSDTGLWYNDEHPTLTIDNLISIAPDFDNITYTAWDAGTTYVVGDKVSSGGSLYICVLGHINQTPPNATYWSAYSPFTNWLKEKTEASIVKVFNTWLHKKFFKGLGSSLLYRDKIFKGTGQITLFDTNLGRTVGHEIVVARDAELALTIKRIGLQFTANQSVDVHLFKSDDPDPVSTQTFVYSGGGGLQWFDVTSWVLEPEGAYYVVYDQDAITGQSVNMFRDFLLGVGGSISFPKFQFFEVSPFSVNTTPSTLWDISQNAYHIDTNFGINLDVSVGCDYTDLFVDEKRKFAPMIVKQVAADLMREFAYNPAVRVNRHQVMADTTQLLYELDGDSQGREGGINLALKQAIESTMVDMSGISRVCSPCLRRGSKWRIA